MQDEWATGLRHLAALLSTTAQRFGRRRGPALGINRRWSQSLDPRRWLLLAGLLCSGAAIAQSADLVVNHADTPDPGPAGGVFTYTVRVDNNGPDAAVGVTLADTLPVGSTFVDVTSTAGSCNAPVSGIVNCALGNLAFNANQTVTIRVRLPSAAVWQHRVTAGSATTDPNTSNNVDKVYETTATQAADLQLLATPSQANVVAGQAYTYALTLNNLGPDAALGSQVITFSVPSGASITAAPSGTGWVCTPSTGYPLSSGSIACTRAATLANGASAATLTVPAVSNINGTVTAAFAVSAFKVDGTAMPDADLSNNTRTVDVASTNGADVAISKSAASANVGLGETVTYTLTPRFNGGLSLASQPITVTDTLGAGLSFVSATGSGWACDATIACTRSGHAGGNFTDMPAITVTAIATAIGTLGNTAAVSTALPDPVGSNDAASVNVASSNDADIQLAKSTSLNPVVPGQPYNYTLRARNTGPLAVGAGQSLAISDAVPAGVTLTGLVSATGWTCDALPLTGPGTWTCTRSGPLAVNTNAPDVVVAAVMPAAAAATNNACVALGGAGRTDPANGNDCSGVTITASATEADLRLVSKTASPASVVAGQNLTYVISVRNDGPAPSTNVTVTDVLGSLVNTGGFQSAVPTQGSCTPNSPTNGTNQTLVCNLGTLASGGSASVTVVVRPSIATTGNRTNTASVRSPEIGDPAQGNNSASATSEVTAIVDLVAAKTAAPVSVPAGAPITFVATVRNDGPSTAQTVRLVDTLPANAAFINLVAVSGGGTCSPIASGAVGGTLTCTWTSLTAGVQQTVTYRVRPLGNAAGGNVVNGIQVSTTTAEAFLDNNRAATTTPVTAPDLDILINKVDSADPVDLAQPTTYTITVNNSGPSYGTNVVMTDVFPAPASTPTAVFSYQGALTVDAGGVCTQPATGATSGTVRCVFPGLESGQTATITYVMRAESLTVTGATSGTAFNDASVTVNETETTLANNRVVHDTTARRTAVATDVQLTMTGPAGPLPPGGQALYSLEVRNNGPLPSDGAQVVVVLPSGLRFVSGAGCVESGGRVTCAVGPLAVGASRTYTLTTQLLSPYAGGRPLVLSASVDAPGDTVPGNNAASASTPVTLIGAGAIGVPTLSQWALMLMSVLLALFGARHLSHRRRA